jgi:hypothetical protein
VNSRFFDPEANAMTTALCEDVEDVSRKLGRMPCIPA